MVLYHRSSQLFLMYNCEDNIKKMKFDHLDILLVIYIINIIMGNTSSYDTITGDSDFAKFPLNKPINNITVEKEKSDSKNSKKTKTKSTKTDKVQSNKILSKELACKVQNCRDPNKLVDIFAFYEEEIILDFYESKICVDLLKQNNIFSIKLAQLMPKNNRFLLQFYFVKVPVEILIIMKDKLDFNAVQNNGCTFLHWNGNTISTNIDYVCDLIDKIDDLDLNKLYNCRTFLDHLFEFVESSSLPPTEKLINLFKILEQKKYNFNHFCYQEDTFLTIALRNHPNMSFQLAVTMKLSTFDITIESRWLYHLLTNSLDHLYNYICYMFQRDDYPKLFLNLYRNLYIDTWGDKFIVFLKKADSIHHKKTIECMEYTDNGDTILHLMAQYHDKTTLQFSLCYFSTLNPKPNGKGKTVDNLYENSKIQNMLLNKPI